MSPDARAPGAAGTGERRPLEPGPPVRGLWWLRSFGVRSPRSRALTVGLVVAAIALTVGLGTWGSDSLGLQPRLGTPLSLYRAVRLYTLDLGPAAGGNGAPRPNWQLWVAFALAAALVLRGALLLWREQIRRFVARYALRGHVVVCGGGVHGARLVQELARDHDVVLVDNDPAALGMVAPRGRHEWRLVGDCVRQETLLAAGVGRANWVVAIPGHDFVSSQVVSAVRSLAASGRLNDRAHVLAQVEDPVLARFLEEEDEATAGPAGPGASTPSRRGLPSPVVSPFSANAIAAETILDETGTGPDGDAANLLLAGDHPLIDAVALAALRRRRVRVLRDLEPGHPLLVTPLHVSLIGPGANTRAERFCGRWGPEPELLSLEARDVEAGAGSLESAEDWLRKPDRAVHAIVACLDELDAVLLTLGLSRVLAGTVRITRVATLGESSLDAQLEARTIRSDELASVSVKSLADLACRPAVMGRQQGPQRLADALAEASRAAAPRAGDGAGDGAGARELSAQLYERAGALGLRSDSAWRVRPCERAILAALLGPVPLSALVRAGLKVELTRPANLRLAAERLSQAGSPAAFAAWCEYVRHLAPAAPAEQVQQLSRRPNDEPAARLMMLRQAALGYREGLTGLQPDGSSLAGAPRVAMVLGAAEGMSRRAVPEVTSLLRGALSSYDGMVLSAATAAGVPGIVGAVARELGMSHRLVGYAPAGRPDENLYPVARRTAGAGEFPVGEALAMWTDIFQAGIALADVRVLVLAGQETSDGLLLARALGARVAYVDPTSETPKSLGDILPLGAGGVLELPADPMTLRAFLQWSQLPPDLRENMARFIHNEYRRKNRGRKAPSDPALAPWADLLPSLQESNRAQADDIPNKLALVGRRIAREGAPLELKPDEVELLAEAEHGRWNIERLSAGWASGDRQVKRAMTPYLRPWAELDDKTRAFDVEAVSTIAPALAEAGWGVVPVGTASPGPHRVPGGPENRAHQRPGLAGAPPPI